MKNVGLCLYIYYNAEITKTYAFLTFSWTWTPCRRGRCGWWLWARTGEKEERVPETRKTRKGGKIATGICYLLHISCNSPEIKPRLSHPYIQTLIAVIHDLSRDISQELQLLGVKIDWPTHRKLEFSFSLCKFISCFVSSLISAVYNRGGEPVTDRSLETGLKPVLFNMLQTTIVSFLFQIYQNFVYLNMSNFVDYFKAVEVGCHFRQMVDDWSNTKQGGRSTKFLENKI